MVFKIMGFKIGALARRTGASTPTIRYYEEIGLLPRADRRSNGQRTYGSDAIERMTLIRRWRDLGFSIKQVKALVGLTQDETKSCVEARDLAATHLTAIREKLDELKKLEMTLAGLVKSCETSCIGGPAPDCVVLDDPAAGADQRSCDANRRRACS